MRTPQYVARARTASYAAAVTSRGSVVRRVPARVGLVGNPSDGYGGAVLATVVPTLGATVTGESADGVRFEGGGESASWGSVAEWREHVLHAGHGDEQRIISAALWTLDDHVRRRRSSNAIDRGIALTWTTDIPRSVGLAGSSALAVATIQTTAAVWDIELDRRVVAALALHAERDVLGITAGWQDRIVQSFGCTVLVDAQHMDVADGLPVPDVHLPVGRFDVAASLVVGWADHIASPSGDYHATVRLAADELAAPMAELASLARLATAAFERGDLASVATALDTGWLIRQRCAPLHPDHAALVEVVRGEGVAATTPGSGGSVVALCIGDEAVARATVAVESAGCRLVCLPMT